MTAIGDYAKTVNGGSWNRTRESPERRWACALMNSSRTFGCAFRETAVAIDLWKGRRPAALVRVQLRPRRLPHDNRSKGPKMQLIAAIDVAGVRVVATNVNDIVEEMI
jgi:hypothetical protein